MPGGAGGWALASAALPEVLAALNSLGPRVEQVKGSFGAFADGLGADNSELSAVGAHAGVPQPLKVEVDDLI